MKKKDVVSVIVPVYNVEKYIARCIESIVKQSYSNIEIILVDDGSTDKSGVICDEYKKIDNRITVIHKKNGGLSDARNNGIDIASGKYITFIDSDDYIAHDMIDLLYDSLKKSDADISICNSYSFWDGDVIENDNNNEMKILETETLLEKYLYQKEIASSAWGKLYKTTLFEKIRYPIGKLCEDLGTTYLLFGKTKRTVINTSKKYYYYQRANSIMHNNVDERRMITLEFSDKIIEYIDNNFNNLMSAAQNRGFAEAIYLLRDIRINKENEKYIKKIWATIKKYRKTVLKDNKSKKINRIYALFSFLGIRALKCIITESYVIMKKRK